jgi:hypothetical protein
MDWSPWCDSPEGDSSNPDDHVKATDGIALYEVSEHRDTRMRRMILTRAADPVDHRDSAYKEGRQRGQTLYALGKGKISIIVRASL